MDLSDEVHAAMRALGAPTDGICFMTEDEAARLRAQLDERVNATQRELKHHDQQLKGSTPC